ncbi:YxeA family protein [Bacillus mobilis]|uniref:IscU protein n=2 Tax=Bacillus cereus group TaxID=86661 RepID=A0A1C4F7P8_BACCE|nr:MULTISPECIES: YxeA family protein [Bacillus cereus group]MCC2463727.1 YxeA family protein [Bacillus mobilis]MCU5432060.1 YxeA family protein [Bacillus mobilis]MCU5591966.1 YxeA family protein [Bacillus mobilis]MCU5735862.1 YxeA family protein [Bacillus mobilis]MCU9559913.1 YxeA family protein [Bacillus mobilis]
MKRFIFGSLLVIVAGAAYLLNGSAAIDRMNPFLNIEHYYAIIDNDGKELGGNKDREYKVKAYDENGKEKEVTIDGVDELPKGSYWYVLTRGKLLHDKVQVTPDEIPDGAKVKLGL